MPVQAGLPRPGAPIRLVREAHVARSGPSWVYTGETTRRHPLSDRAAEFDEFYVEIEPRLRVALTAAYGLDDGRDATAEALSWAWEHWERVAVMEQPLRYLYRVGQSRTRRLRRPTPRFPPAPLDEGTNIEPALPGALGSLSRSQRVAVLLVHGFDWSHAEVAAVLGTTSSTVATHLARGLRRLREVLKVGIDV